MFIEAASRRSGGDNPRIRDSCKQFLLLVHLCSPAMAGLGQFRCEAAKAKWDPKFFLARNCRYKSFFESLMPTWVGTGADVTLIMTVRCLS